MKGLAPFEQDDSWLKTSLGGMTDAAEVALKDPILKVSLNPKLPVRHVWATIEPYLWQIVPPRWAWEFAVVFFRENKEVGVLRYPSGNNNVSALPANNFARFQQNTGSGEAGVLRYRPLEANTAGYEDIFIQPRQVQVVADEARLYLVRNECPAGAAATFNGVLAGLRIVSQIPFKP